MLAVRQARWPPRPVWVWREPVGGAPEPARGRASPQPAEVHGRQARALQQRAQIPHLDRWTRWRPQTTKAAGARLEKLLKAQPLPPGSRSAREPSASRQENRLKNRTDVRHFGHTVNAIQRSQPVRSHWRRSAPARAHPMMGGCCRRSPAHDQRRYWCRPKRLQRKNTGSPLRRLGPAARRTANQEVGRVPPRL